MNLRLVPTGEAIEESVECTDTSLSAQNLSPETFKMAHFLGSNQIQAERDRNCQPAEFHLPPLFSVTSGGL